MKSNPANRRILSEGWFTTPRLTHQRDLIRAFVVGVLNADMFYFGYQTPPNFQEIIDYVARKVNELVGKEEIVNISPVDASRRLVSWASECSDFLDWGEPVGITIVTATSAPFKTRQAMDLDAVRQNIAVHLRDMHRLMDDFDKRFAEGKRGD